MAELKTLTPFGVELITKKNRFFGYLSKVRNGDKVIYTRYSARTDELRGSIEDFHKIALFDFMRIAKNKDLRRPIN